MRTKNIFFLSIACAVILIISSCTGNSKSKKIREVNGKTYITVVVPNLPDPSSEAPYAQASYKALQRFINDFPRIFEKKYRARYEAHPEIYGNYDWSHVRINLVRYKGVYIGGRKTDKLAIATDTAPDLLYTCIRKSTDYINNGFLHPLDEFYKRLANKEKANLIPARIKDIVFREGMDGKKHYWTVPYGTLMGRCVAYRKDVLKAHNIPYPDDNWTWADFMNICRKTTDISKGQYGLRLGKGLHESWYWTSFLWSAGGKVSSLNKLKNTWEYAFDSDEAVKALDFYTQLCWEKHGKYRGYAYRDVNNVSKMWQDGKITMLLDYIEGGCFTRFNKELYGIAPLPLGPDRIRGGELNCKMLGMNVNLKNPVVRDAAWEYMLSLNSEETRKIYVKKMVEAGEAEAANPEWLKKYGYASLITPYNKELLRIYKLAIATGIPEPYETDSSRHVYELMTMALRQAALIEIQGRLAPVGSKKRYQQLKDILETICAHANNIDKKY